MPAPTPCRWQWTEPGSLPWRPARAHRRRRRHAPAFFENCRLDYSTFEQVRAAGPVAFSRCVLSETTFTGCDLTRAVLEDCTLRATEFGRGTYKDVDLRGNELSGVRGVANLARVIIDHAQQADLGQALTAELAVTWGEDLPVGRAGR